ncbi:MBL fold metallo-hydrolase [Roseateles sp. LYH14W]|uniref:MBL fold metallo-hydrolase n=1 Tax=Pelomonas parva TaxID=3299032 RepID=A0ABW7F1W8_9BURK
MSRRRYLGLSTAWLMAAVLPGCALTPAAPDAAALLQRADLALGSANVKTLSFQASGTGGVFGQAREPGGAWPWMNYTQFARSFDYANNAMREAYARSRADMPAGQTASVQRVTGFARERWSWGVAGTSFAAVPALWEQRLHDLWTSPHGVVIAARQHGAVAGRSSEGGSTFDTLTYAVPGLLTATAWLDAAGRVVRVDSKLPNPVLGDTDVVTRYGDYRPSGTAQFPMRIQQSQGGHPVFDLTVSEVQVNPPLDIAVPDNVKAHAERVVTEKLADGVWFLGGGSHNSVLVEMSNHVVLVEAPLHDARSAVVLAEVRRLVPGKPLKTVINTHHHFDHAGGLRAVIAEGATLVTSQLTKPYYERVLAQANTVAPDALARSGRKPEILGVDGQLALVDGERRIEMHAIVGSQHSQGFLMVYVPHARLLIEADAYNPAPPGSPPPARPSDSNVNLVENIERLQLPVERIAPLHGRVVPYGDLLTVIGRR